MGRVILEFIGGCWDGMNLASDSSDPLERRLARQCYARSWYGSVGRRISVCPDYATRIGPNGGNHYRVVSRTESDDTLLLRLECSEPDRCEWQSEVKRVIVEFIGGVLGGVRLDSASSDTEEALLALSYYTVTDQGRGKHRIHAVGAAGWVQRRYGRKVQHHCSTGNCAYTVARRLENLGTVAMKLAFAPSAEPEDTGAG